MAVDRWARACSRRPSLLYRVLRSRWQCLKWAHDELLGQGLAVVSFGCLDSVEEIQTLFCHRARGSAPPEQPSVRRAGPAGGHAPPCVLGHAQPSHG